MESFMAFLIVLTRGGKGSFEGKGQGRLASFGLTACLGGIHTTMRGLDQASHR
jgi:hypothetical protein